MARTLTPAGWFPWLLALAAFVVFMLAVGPFGIALAIWWGVVLVVARAEVAFQRVRASLIAIDAAFAAIAFLGGFEGGWYLLPAIGVFVLMDWTVGDDDPGMPPSDRLRLGYIFGVAGLVAVPVGVGAFAWLGAYASVTSSAPGAARLSFLDLAPEPWAYGGIALALFASGLMAVGLLAIARKRAWGPSTLALSFIVLSVAAILTVSGVLFLAPAVLLAGVSFQLLRMESLHDGNRSVGLT
jgi:hypothetical protein